MGRVKAPLGVGDGEDCETLGQFSKDVELRH